MWLALFLGSLYTTSLTHASLTSLNSSSHLTTSESVNLSKKKKKFSFSPSQRLNFKSTFAFGFFFFPSHPHDVSVSISPSVLCSLLLGFIRYWFFSFDFDFDYLILFLSFDHFLSSVFFFFVSFNFISNSPFMLVVEHLVHMMILISIFFMTNKACVIKWTLKLSNCLFETLKLICYLDVMNLFAICHLDVNVMTNELIYLVLLKVYYVKVL